MTEAVPLAATLRIEVQGIVIDGSMSTAWLAAVLAVSTRMGDVQSLDGKGSPSPNPVRPDRRS